MHLAERASGPILQPIESSVLTVCSEHPKLNNPLSSHKDEECYDAAEWFYLRGFAALYDVSVLYHFVHGSKARRAIQEP